MGFEKIHNVLSKGEDLAAARRRVLAFFEKTTLVNYDQLEIVDAASLRATDPGFRPALEQAMAGNQRVMEELAAELKANGCRELDDLLTLVDPYSCKLVHILAHFVDGFPGIDSVFYNILEDSHRVSAKLRQSIDAEPHKYWLLRARGEFGSRDSVSLLHG